MRLRLGLSLCISFAFGAWAALARGQTAETARVLDAAGGWATNAAWRSVAAVAQPGPAGLATNAAHVNWSGFMQSFLMFPGRDADADGRPDENDLDDDDDGLADATEIVGSAFMPTTATDPLRRDSDGDGASDGAEAGAGTNPQDPGSDLRISAIQPVGDGATVTWLSRSGYTYDLLAGDTVPSLASNAAVVAQQSASGGTGAWQQTESTATNLAAPSSRFYRVRVSSAP